MSCLLWLPCSFVLFSAINFAEINEHNHVNFHTTKNISQTHLDQGLIERACDSAYACRDGDAGGY